jgi:hypothetical protein
MPMRRAVIPFFAAIVALTAPQVVAADWADPAKVLRIAFPIDVSGLDPAGTQETYATAVEGRIFDALYQWDYLARPYRFVPSVATGMPEISADGRVWTIRIRSGVYFADDPVFAGKKRELTAADFVYAWKRIVDPRVRSPNSDLLEHKIVGLDAAVAKAKSSGRFDYDAEVQGLRAGDRYTIKLELIEPDYTFLQILDSTALRAVAREVIEKYGDSSGRAMQHPVGTGPYRLKEWQPGHRIILEANPAYREERFPPAPASADAAIKAVADSMKGKRLPQIGRIEIAIVEETNPRLLMFNAGQTDMLDVPGDVAPKMIDSKGNLLPEYAARGIRLERATELAVTFSYFNMEDPVVGGYTPEKVALRRAVCSAYNLPDEIRVIRTDRRGRRRNPSHPTSRDTCPDTRDCLPTILRRRGRSSTSSAIATAMATGPASCRTAGRSPFTRLRSSAPCTGNTMSYGCEACARSASAWISRFRPSPRRSRPRMRARSSFRVSAGTETSPTTSCAFSTDPTLAPETSLDSGMPSRTPSTTRAAAPPTLRNATRSTKP